MVKISQSTKTIKLTFSTIEGSEVVLRDSLTGEAFQQATKAAKGEDETRFVFVCLAKMIKEWNLEGDDDKPLEITEANIKLIDMWDLKEVFYATTFGKRAEELVKKNQT